MAPLKFKTLHRNSIFAIENHLSLAKCPPYLSVVSSATTLTQYIHSQTLRGQKQFQETRHTLAGLHLVFKNSLSQKC